jgi:hypothetical protein
MANSADESSGSASSCPPATGPGLARARVRLPRDAGPAGTLSRRHLAQFVSVIDSRAKATEAKAAA